MPSTSVPNLIQFLESVPPPVTFLLVELAPFISLLRWAAEVVSWKCHWSESWLVVASFWAICLSINIVLRYLLPLAVLLPPLLPYLPARHLPPRQTQLTTEQSLSLALSDITIILSHIPNLPSSPNISFHAALRLSALLFVPYTILTYLVPLPVLIGTAGTFLLTYRSPWACTLRTVLWRSAYIRRFLLRLWSRLTGITPPPLTPFTIKTADIDPQMKRASAPASRPIRFLFTILECQRWWMGLDWTAALLPGERPSWCSTSQQPVSPPSAFSLPPPTSIYFPGRESKGIKRTATWRWEEGQWGVWINKEGTDPKRVEKKPPALEDEEGGARIASKAASMLRERAASIGSRPDMSLSNDDRDLIPTANVAQGLDFDDQVATDTDGWVYGDNKWESTGPKGGIGKYTRYRRWTRIAILEERVEELEMDHEANVDPAGVTSSATVNPLHGERRDDRSELPRTRHNSHRAGGENNEGVSGPREGLNASGQGTSNAS